jgi:flagellar biosynthesis/type III secretory pathway protein FliH
MVLTTSWKEEGLVEGRAAGLAEGRAEGLAEGLQKATNILLRQIRRKFPELTHDVMEQVRVLNISQLGELADVLLDFSTPQDLVTWLAAQH